MKRPATTALLAALLCSCGTTSHDSEQKPVMASSSAHSATQEADRYSIGDSVNLTGSNGTPLKAILDGVLYADSHTKDYDGDDPYAVAVAFTLVALGDSDQLSAPVEGREFRWADGQEQRSVTDATTPWEGCINGYNPHQTLMPNTPTKVIVDLLTPSKGGTLSWNDETGPIQWALPDKDSGHGTEPAAKYITDYC